MICSIALDPPGGSPAKAMVALLYGLADGQVAEGSRAGQAAAGQQGEHLAGTQQGRLKVRQREVRSFSIQLSHMPKSKAS